MGTLDDSIKLIALAEIEPKIDAVVPTKRTEETFRAVWEGWTLGKTVFMP
jgi:hypothetical protein